MSEQNKTLELKEEDLEKVSGGASDQITQISDIEPFTYYMSGPDKCFYVKEIRDGNYRPIYGDLIEHGYGGCIVTTTGSYRFEDFVNEFVLSTRPSWL